MSPEPLSEHTPQSTVAYGPDSAFATFLSWTDEKARLSEALELEVDSTYETLLDVGAGDGSITRPLGAHFQRVVALEPSGEFVDIPSNTMVVPQRVEDYLSGNSSTFDFVLASHVFIYVANPGAVVRQLNSRVNRGGRLAVIMLEGKSEYQKFIDAFAKEANPALKERSTFKSSHLMQTFDESGISWRRNLITSSLIAPSVEEFLSINRMYFNCNADALSDELIARMKAHLAEHVEDDGRLVLDLQHGIYVVEH